MSGKPIVLRERAQRDVDEAAGHYLTEAGKAVVLDFIDTLEDACRQIGAQPATGSPRYAHQLDSPGLRFRIVKRFPYMVFYVEREAEIASPYQAAGDSRSTLISSACFIACAKS